MIVLYIFIVHNLELESENSHPVLVGERLLHRVVVDVPVDQVQFKWVPGHRYFVRNAEWDGNFLIHELNIVPQTLGMEYSNNIYET